MTPDHRLTLIRQRVVQLRDELRPLILRYAAGDQKLKPRIDALDGIARRYSRMAGSISREVH